MEALESSASKFKLRPCKNTRVTLRAVALAVFLVISTVSAASESSTENGSDQSSGRKTTTFFKQKIQFILVKK